MTDFIKIENLVFDYIKNEDGHTIRAIDDVSFTVERGSFTAVIGQNGSGKSTLAKNINGLLMPTSGKIYVDGLDTSDEANIWDIRQKVAMVFQNPDNQIVSSIVEDDVAFGPENLGIDPAEIRTRVDEALMGVEMYEHRKKARYAIDTCGLNIKKGVLQLKWMQEVIYVPFGDMMAPIPAQYDAYLKHFYGPNYMSLLPIDKRVSGHNMARLDLGPVIYGDEAQKKFDRMLSIRGDLMESDGRQGLPLDGNGSEDKVYNQAHLKALQKKAEKEALLEVIAVYSQAMEFAAIIPICAKTGEGLEQLADVVEEWFGGEMPCDGSILTNARQADAVRRAVEYMEAAFRAMEQGMTPDIVLTETEGAMAALGELSGRTVREDVTNRIFQRFCVGK